MIGWLVRLFVVRKIWSFIRGGSRGSTGSGRR